MRPIHRLSGIALATAAAAPLPALAQRLGGGTGPEISLVRILAALALCIGAAIALALFLGREGRPAKGWSATSLAERLRSRQRIVIVEARRVSAHADVCLVACDGREYLLVCGAGEIRVLAETAAATVAEAA